MKLKIIVGSTRQGRSSDKVATWVTKHIGDQAETEVLDLRDYNLPMLDDAISPQYNPDRKPEGGVKQWLDKLAEADALIIITPEYNRSIPGVLKNAIDQIALEVKGKPVGLIAHGSNGGAQALSDLRHILPGLFAFAVPTPVYLPGMASMIFDDEGNFTSDYAFHEERLVGGLSDQITELKRYSGCACKDCKCDNCDCKK